MEDRFPEIWMPSTEQRDLRTLLRDRYQWMKMRARLRHTLHRSATLAKRVARYTGQLNVGILEHFLNATCNAGVFLGQAGPGSGEIP
jgi:hypothetical protein